MLLKNAQMLTEYLTWANDTLYESLTQFTNTHPADQLKEEALQKVLRQCNHIRIIDLIWKAHLSGEKHDFTVRNPTEGLLPFAELKCQQQAINAWYLAWGKNIAEAELSEAIDFTLIGGQQGRMTRYEILLHVVNHTSFHRGMVVNVLFGVNFQHLPTDLTVFTLLNKAK